MRGLCLIGVWILSAQQTEKTLGAGRSEPEPEPEPEAKSEPEVKPEAEPEPEPDEDADLSGAIRLGQAFGTVLGVGVGLQLHAPPADVTGLWRVCSGAGAEAEPLEVASVAAGAEGAAVAEVIALQQHTSGAVVGREHRGAPCADSQSCVLLGRWSHHGVLQLQQTFPERAETAPVLWELTPVLLRAADAGGPGDGWSLQCDRMTGRWGGARGGPCEIVRYSAAAEVALAAATLRLSHLGAEEIRRAVRTGDSTTVALWLERAAWLRTACANEPTVDAVPTERLAAGADTPALQQLSRDISLVYAGSNVVTLDVLGQRLLG
eukprot:COSAG01_NODE_2027_length_8600_cov_3.986356_11_plen_321_part_00